MLTLFVYSSLSNSIFYFFFIIGSRLLADRDAQALAVQTEQGKDIARVLAEKDAVYMQVCCIFLHLPSCHGL